MILQFNQYLLGFLDTTLTILHLLFIGFFLFGWCFKKFRNLHYYSVLIVGVSWFLLGLYYGFGYCPLTDYHWRIKEMRGEHDLPYSFIEYVIEASTGHDVSSDLVNYITLMLFLSIFILSLYLRYVRVKNSNANKCN